MVFRPNIYGDTLQWIFADTHSEQDTTISVVDTPVQLNRSSGITTGEQKNMTIDATGIVTCKVAGMFMLQYHCSFSGASNDEFTMYWRINSTNQTSGKTKWTMKGGDKWAISSQTMINLQEGDTIDLYIENNTDTSNITLENFNQTIFKISSTPTTFLFSPAPPAPPDTSFTFTMITTNSGSASNTFVLPLVDDGTIDIEVDWGDSSTDTITAYDQTEVTHVYSATGTYTIKMSGTIRGFQVNNSGDKLKILNISKWGDFNFTLPYTFYGCENLTSDATDSPTISTTNLQYTFLICTNLEGGLSAWDVSSVTNMFGFLNGCQAFNDDLSLWQVGETTSMRDMFATCLSFEGTGLSNWDVSKCENMDGMFNGATDFSEDIGSWDTGECLTFYNMFRSPCKFNKDIGSWDTAKIQTIGAMFYWNTFFNQDIGNWDLGSCTNMWGAFNYATTFDQDLGGWDIADVTELTNFLRGGTLSTANYDALLLGWDAQSVQSGLNFHAGSSTYTGGGAVATARANLISSDSWTITDGGIA